MAGAPTDLGINLQFSTTTRLVLKNSGGDALITYNVTPGTASGRIISFSASPATAVASGTAVVAEFQNASSIPTYEQDGISIPGISNGMTYNLNTCSVSYTG
jgi:hypothetical protein